MSESLHFKYRESIVQAEKCTSNVLGKILPFPAVFNVDLTTRLLSSEPELFFLSPSFPSTFKSNLTNSFFSLDSSVPCPEVTELKSLMIARACYSL